VVKIEAAQKILFGLAVAAVLGDDQTWYDFQASAGRENGRALTSSPLTFFSLADPMGAWAVLGPEFETATALAAGGGRSGDTPP
jgi:hypothetical protein